MSDYLRPRVPGACIFFSVALAHRGSALLLERLELLRAAVRETQVERPFHIDAWVVLPDHLHAVWSLPEGDADYAVRWGAIKARFTMSLGKESRPGFSPAQEFQVIGSGRYAGLKPGLRKNKRERPVWQRRFWEHHIRDEVDYAAHIRYCWLNPVKHGFADHPTDWVPSSIHRDIRLGRVDPEWCGEEMEGTFGEIA